KPPRVELREIEHVTYEPLEAVRLRRDHVQRLRLRLRLVPDSLAPSPAMAPDRGERRPQLVRDRHEEVPLELLCSREPRRHVAEPLREMRDFIASLQLRQGDVVTALGDL